MQMIVKIEITHRKAETNITPWGVYKHEFPAADSAVDELVECFADREDAVFCAQCHTRDGWHHSVHRVPDVEEAWFVEHTWQDGCGFGSKHLSRAAAEQAAEKAAEEIGRIEIYGSEYDTVVVRPAAKNKWTAARGIGSHTTHIPGSHATREDAEIAGVQACRQAWNEACDYWTAIAEYYGIEAHITFGMRQAKPEITVKYPETGQSAWDCRDRELCSAAAEMGRKGGQKKGGKKAEASRKNGKKGGSKGGYRIEHLNLDGQGEKRVRVYDMPAAGDYWAAVTNVTCPVCDEGALEWAEAGYVPGYRICSGCGRHYVAAGTAAAPCVRLIGGRRGR